MSKPKRPIEATFYDCKTGESFTEGVDALGQDVVGDDAHGDWWGTTRAAWVLPCYVDTIARLMIVSGMRGASPYDGAFIASSTEDAVSYAARRGVRVTHVEIICMVPTPVCEAKAPWTDEEIDARLREAEASEGTSL